MVKYLPRIYAMVLFLGVSLSSCSSSCDCPISSRAELLQCPFEQSPCVPNFLDLFCGSVLWALMSVLNRIGPRSTRVPVILLWMHSAPLGASGTLDPVCCSCSSSPSLFVRNFPHATILSPSTRVQTAEIKHVVFPWKTHYFSKPCVGSPILVPPCYILRPFSIYSLSSNYPSQKWSLKPCRLLRSG